MQNVKRRVYDWLNVLLAFGVIRKVDTKIMKNKLKKLSFLTTINSSRIEQQILWAIE